MNLGYAEPLIDRSPIDCDKAGMRRYSSYNAEDRRREKEASRRADESAMQSGLISVESLAAENGFFSSLDLSNARVRRRPRQIA